MSHVHFNSHVHEKLYIFCTYICRYFCTYGTHTYDSLLQETKMSLSLDGTSFRDLDRSADRVHHGPMASKLTRHSTVELKTAFSLVVSDWEVSESNTWTISTGHRESTRR